MPISCSVLDNDSQEITPKLAHNGGTISQHFTFCLQDAISLFNGNSSLKNSFEVRISRGSETRHFNEMTEEQMMKQALVNFFLLMGEDTRQKGFPIITQAIKYGFSKKEKINPQTQWELIQKAKTEFPPMSKIGAYIPIFFTEVMFKHANNIDHKKLISQFKEAISEITIDGVKKVNILGEAKYVSEKQEQMRLKKLFFEPKSSIPSELCTLLDNHQYADEYKKDGLDKKLERLLKNLSDRGNDEDLKILLKYKYLFDINAQDEVGKTALHYALPFEKCFNLLIESNARTDIPDAQEKTVRTAVLNGDFKARK